MEPETRKELWAVIQAVGSLYCCVIGTYAIIHPPGAQVTTSQGAGVMSPHLVWWQWILIGGFAVCAFSLAIGAVLNFRGARRLKDARLTDVDSILAGLPKQPQQGKPAWRKLQWCNAERERLEREVRKLKDEAESTWRQGFASPRWEVVQGHNFVNTSIEIDGKAFRHCRFENVTFMFHGKAPVEFTSDNLFTGDKARFDTDDPAVMAFMQLRMIVEKIPGATIVTGALDKKGNVMPDNFKIIVPPVATGDMLHPRKEAEMLSDEIRQFVLSLGRRPERNDSNKQNSEAEELEAMRKHSAVIGPWLQRLQAGWLGRFEERAQKIRHLLVEQGITDIDLDMALRAQTTDEKRFMRIADRLLILSRANTGQSYERT
jgi:hypothetical protein